MKHSTSHTILPSGRSVEDCLQILEAAEKKTMSLKHPEKELLDDSHDDYCVYCGIGGDLLCCETCPVTCHYNCAGLESAPEAEWYCPGCICCLCDNKMYACMQDSQNGSRVYRGNSCYIGQDSASSSPYRDILDSSAQPKKLLLGQHETRNISEQMECKPSFKRKSSDMYLSDPKKHHSNGNEKIDSPKRDWTKNFDEVRSVCGTRAHSSCISNLPQPIYAGMPWYNKTESMVVTELTHICSQGALKIGEYSCGSDVSFQVIHAAAAAGEQVQGLAPYYTNDQKISLRKILSGCLAVLNDSYNEIWDSRTGINLIPMMLRGQCALPHIDFSGTFVTPLFINSTIVSVACFRMLGTGIAELPLLATRQEIRGCKAGRTLLNKIEEILYELGVTKLVTYATYCPLYPYLPAVHPQGEELPPPSQGKFGFKIASRETVSTVIAHGGMRIPGVPWVEKSLEHVNWSSRMRALKETRLELNPRVLDINSRLRSGVLSLVNRKTGESVNGVEDQTILSDNHEMELVTTIHDTVEVVKSEGNVDSGLLGVPCQSRKESDVSIGSLADKLLETLANGEHIKTLYEDKNNKQ